MGRTFLRAAMLAAVALAALAGAGNAFATEQVTGLSAVQDRGFTTLSWTPAPGATDYQIERTLVDASDVAIGTATIVGVWRPNRQVTQDSPRFADAGYNPGQRLRWRVRARVGTTTFPYSEPVFGTTLSNWGDPSVAGENLRTQWETTNGTSYTSDLNEYAYTEQVDTLSDRVRVVEIARTAQNRPVNMFIIGYPNPPATPAAVAATRPALVNCNVHGNEPSSREACLILARQLAFGNDARTLDILSKTTVLLVPAINSDGRANNTRGNTTGQDLNRDYSQISQPETFGFVKMMRDYKPRAAFDGHEFGNNNAGDLPVLPPRHQNVGQTIFDQSQDMITNWFYNRGSEDGWWYCPYGCQGGGNVGLSEETILRNAMGLKNTIGSLLEARSAGGTTRPAEGTNSANRQRKTYSALYTYNKFLDYFVANQDAIETAREQAIAFQTSNANRIVFRGSRPIPAFAAPHPGEAPPPLDAPTAANILDTPPCGYMITDAQYTTPLVDSAPGFPTSVAQRIDAHGWKVDDRASGHIVRLRQAERGLIPLLLDQQAAEEWIAALRLFECPWISAAPRSYSLSAVEGTSPSRTLTIGNITTDPDDLNWTITEAASDCNTPSDLPWVSARLASGTTASGDETSVTIDFSTAAVSAPNLYTGVLCLRSNDAGESLIQIPLSFQVEYPFVGFLPPVSPAPAINAAEAGSVLPVKFQLGGDRGLAVFAAGSPSSVEVDCTTLAPSGARTAISNALVWDGEKYQLDWKTNRQWRNSCRQLTVTLADGTTHVAYFRFS